MINVKWDNHQFQLRRVWKYQKGNHNPYIEEQTTQWSKEKGQQEKQRSTKHAHTTKDLQNMHIKLKIEQHEPH